jgi:hypothetical protein
MTADIVGLGTDNEIGGAVRVSTYKDATTYT